MFNLEHWPVETLQAYTILLTMSFIVLALTFVLREVGRRELDALNEKENETEADKSGYADSQGELTEMEVLQIRQLSPTIKSFRLKPLGRYVNYQAGQFLAFHTGAKQNLVRCYSLNSTPSRPGLYEVSVRKLEGGLGSTWMHEQVKIGDKLKVNNPVGRFTFKQQAKASIFVAGGIGITPMMSMLKYAVDTGDQRELYFFYAGRSLEELVFHDELLIIASRSCHIHYIPMMETIPEKWPGAKGRISTEMMLATGLNFAESDLYTCGPAPMMDSVKEIALANGMPKENFYNEVFASPNSETQSKVQCKVTFEGQVYDYDDNIPLLNFLEKQGKELPYSCRAGVCGSCECTITKGKVKMLESDYLNEDDIKAGRRLSCISYPVNDISIEV